MNDVSKKGTNPTQLENQLSKDLGDTLTVREQIIKMQTIYNNIQIDHYKDLFERTKNPLWVWTAISYCLSPPEKRNEDRRFTHIVGDEYEKAENDKELFDDNAIEDAIDTRMRNIWRAIYAGELQTLPIPEWCLEYLGQCASSIVELVTNKEIAPKDAASKIPEVLGMTRRGWNAFAEDRKETDRQLLHRKFEDLVYREGVTKTEARKMLLEESGLEDERSLQRILAIYSK